MYQVSGGFVSSESILCDKRILQLYCRYSVSFHYDVLNEIK